MLRQALWENPKSQALHYLSHTQHSNTLISAHPQHTPNVETQGAAAGLSTEQDEYVFELGNKEDRALV